MNRNKQLAKNTVILAIGTFLPKLAAIVTIPIITGQLTKKEYGTYDLLSTLATLLLPIMTLQIQAAAFRFLIDCRGDKDKTKSVVTNIYAFVIPTLIASLSILYLFTSKYSFSTRSLIVLFVGTNTFISVTLQIVRGLAQNKLYSFASAVRSITNMLLIIVMLLFAKLGLNGVLLAYVGAALIGIVILFAGSGIHKYIEIKLCSGDVIRKLLLYSWPMIPNTLSGWVLNVSDRFVLNSFLGIEAVAVYSAANKIPTTFTAVLATFILAWQENASVAVNDNDVEKYYSITFDKVFCLLTGAMAFIIGLTPLLFRLLIRGDYSDSYSQMPFLFLGIFFSGIASFLGGIYVAHKRTKNVGITTMICAGINLLVDFAMVNQFGIYAASVSTFLSYALLAVYRMHDVKRFQMLNYKYWKIVISLICLTVMCVACWINKPVPNIFNFVAGAILAVVLNLEIIRKVISVCTGRVRNALFH